MTEPNINRPMEIIETKMLYEIRIKELQANIDHLTFRIGFNYGEEPDEKWLKTMIKIYKKHIKTYKMLIENLNKRS